MLVPTLVNEYSVNLYTFLNDDVLNEELLRFHIPQSFDGRIELSARELSAILSGIKPQRYYKRYSKKS